MSSSRISFVKYCVWDSFTLLYVVVDHSFSLLCDILLWDCIIWMICSFRQLRPVEIIWKHARIVDLNCRDVLGIMWLNWRKSCLSSLGPDGFSVIVECRTWLAEQTWLSACFAHTALLEHSPAYSFTYYLWLPSCYNSGIEELKQRQSSMQSWKYLLFSL